MRISIQGMLGSYHHIVARELYGNDNGILERDSFEEVFIDVDDGNADLGIIAIENSIAGSILTNYDLLLKWGHKIIGEYYLRINHQLLALPGQKIKDINEVRSHPMAIQQCLDFLKKHHLKALETEDTAGSAKEISEKKLQGVAAIAGKLAAEIYNLEIIAPDIETDKQNYTRFLIISKNQESKQDTDKTSVMVELNHKPGSLYELIGVFHHNLVNMTKIESRPIIGSPFNYRFYIDFELGIDSELGQKILHELHEHASRIVMLGTYKSNKLNYDV